MEENNGGGPAAESLVLINTPYNPRLELNGFYILLFSNERGIFYFSPILLAGVWGLGILYKQKKERTAVSVIVGSALICVLTYSMFGDPWGGWAYGARYMIPAEALLALGVGAAFESLKKLPSQLLVGVLLIYSVAVAVVGTVTTTSVPPKVEAVHLQSYIPYTYQRGVDLIEQNFSNSLVYNSIFEGRASVESFYFLMLFIVLALPISLWGIYFFNRGAGK